ncbi:MAG: 6-phosphogluconolactonase [Anaerolineae bacterium]|nr:6-phosphogluconolactonase [Anaerolineae bacterium]
MSDWKSGEIKVYADADTLAQAAAEHFVEQAAEAIAARDRFVVALAGGATPRATYALLASWSFATRVDWLRVHFLWGDERCVPPDHRDSNYRLVRQALLNKILIPNVNVHRIRGELEPAWAAMAYESELEALLEMDGRFDLILLGMGEDGHTASLFPGTAALEEQTRWVVETHVEKLSAWRITLTLPVINAARQVTFLVSGASKAEPLARIQAGEPLPAGLVQPTGGKLTWLVDQQASHR